MGSNLNFKNFTNDLSSNTSGGGGRPPENFLLARQPSIYSLTFDEFQNTMVGSGKDFGSMNMDELLKNIWSAEENHATSTTSSLPQEGLQRQGSLTLPRTLSQKTVDEVWKDIAKEYGGIVGGGGASLPQRQQTLGEMTLEEFLAKAGVVREDTQVAAKVITNGSLFGDVTRTANNSGLGIGFQGNRAMVLNNNASNQVTMHSSNLPLNVNGVRSNQGQAQAQGQAHQQQMFSKQSNAGYLNPVPLQTSPRMRNGIMGGVGDQGRGGGLMQTGAVGMVGLAGVGTGSPASQISSDGIGKSNGDTSSVSPVPYVFNGGLRGRRAGGTVEKVAERRQRRMIKNRESAARSRARKQAYTMELEAEVAKLKEENQELVRKQAEIMEMQKNQAMEMMNMKMQQGSKRQCLRRTQTGPW
ncbi:hypothetical protein K2173_026164 [Erythroxylum novogranatense]|uniref:BZIP domain-containing protein n=1 Tax=Erythroxylum novogranatense TaxID=1862640 RepID=A0AAV8TAN6_9ROSI|nr:hypothetical protein K2173_026164 [Erythroxylum novogranatense]